MGQVRSYVRRSRSGRPVVVRAFSRRNRANANAAPAVQRKARQRKTKAAGGQLKAGLKFGKGGRVVKDRNANRVKARRKAQRRR